MHGNWFIKSAETDKSRWNGRTFSEGDRIEEVYAVPVEQDETDWCAVADGVYEEWRRDQEDDDSQS